MGPGAPEYQQAIVRAYEGLRQRTQVRAEMKKMVDLYRPGGAWWQANAGNKPRAAQRLQRHGRGHARDGDRVPPGGAEDAPGGDVPARARHLQAVRGRVRLQRGSGVRLRLRLQPALLLRGDPLGAGGVGGGRRPVRRRGGVQDPGSRLGARGLQRVLPQERRVRRGARLRQAGEDRARPARQERPQGRPEGRREQVQGRRREEAHRQEGREGAAGAAAHATSRSTWSPPATRTTRSTRTTRTRSTCATRRRSSSTTATTSWTRRGASARSSRSSPRSGARGTRRTSRCSCSRAARSGSS